MKTEQELNQLKKEVEVLNKKLKDLSEEELKKVTGGSDSIVNTKQYEYHIYKDTTQDFTINF